LLRAGFELVDDVLICNPVLTEEAAAIIADNADEELILMIVAELITECALSRERFALRQLDDLNVWRCILTAAG